LISATELIDSAVTITCNPGVCSLQLLLMRCNFR